VHLDKEKIFHLFCHPRPFPFQYQPLLSYIPRIFYYWAEYLVLACPVRLLLLHSDFSNFLCIFLLLVYSQTIEVIPLIYHLTHVEFKLT